MMTQPKLCLLAAAVLTVGCNEALDNDAGTVAWKPYTPPSAGAYGAINLLQDDAVAYFVRHDASKGAIPDGTTVEGTRATCLRRTSGACTATKCTLEPDSTHKFAPPEYASCGTLSAQCGNSAPVEFTAEGSDPLTYALASFPCATGETVTVKATGDTVPAFEGQRVRSAGEKLLAPDPLVNVSVSRSESLALEWVAAPGEVAVRLDGSVLIECRFAASAGQGEVPSQLLGELEAGEVTNLYIGYQSFTVIEPSGWKVTLSDWEKPAASWDGVTIQP